MIHYIMKISLLSADIFMHWGYFQSKHHFLSHVSVMRVIVTYLNY